MDTFRIDSPFDKDDFIRISLIRWKILNRENRKQLINWSIISIIVLAIGIIGRTENEPTNPFIFIGIFLFIFSLFLFYNMIFSKQRYNRKIKETAEEFNSIKMDCTYEFSDESVKYWDKEKKVELNWSVFTNYSIYKNYLILVISNSLISSYIFEKKETDIDEYNKILEIVKSKLEYKEIKQ